MHAVMFTALHLLSVVFSKGECHTRGSADLRSCMADCNDLDPGADNAMVHQAYAGIALSVIIRASSFGGACS